MSPIDSIQPLIPLPAPTPSRATQKARDDEAAYDKYAILFSPPTPRPSPIPGMSVRTANPPAPASISTSPSDGDFGAFVSVPPSEDPLAAFTPIDDDFSSFPSPNPSHDYFGKVAQEARIASEKNKHGVLDELLLSEVDPLYWPKPQPKISDSPDLDMDFFMPKAEQPSSPMPPSSHHRPHPSRSPTLTTATLAPPMTSPSTVSSPPTPASVPSHLNDSGLRRTPPPRSQSYQTLSHISARLLPQKQPHPPPARHDTLQSLFNPPSELPISHGTPFASHDTVFVPPTGAPGFKGDVRNWDKGYSEELEHERTRPSTPSDMGAIIEKKTGYVDLKGRRDMTVGVLDTKLANRLRQYLPALVRLPRAWNLLYSLDQHGISLNTLYSRCDLPKPTPQILIIQDANDGLFGVYMGEGIRPSKGRGYYGSGESFVFKLVKDELRVFKWTGRNDYIALCEPAFISFGGGDGQYGVYVDEGLIDGSSAGCPTFGNEPLCSKGPVKAGAVAFECVGLEVWKVG